jgi:hypothetical protein
MNQNGDREELPRKQLQVGMRFDSLRGFGEYLKELSNTDF